MTLLAGLYYANYPGQRPIIINKYGFVLNKFKTASTPYPCPVESWDDEHS